MSARYRPFNSKNPAPSGGTRENVSAVFPIGAAAEWIDKCCGYSISLFVRYFHRGGKARALLDERDKLAALRAASLVSHLAVPRFCAGDNQSLNDLRIVSPLLLFAAPSREISSQATKSSRPLASKDSRNFG